MAVDFTGTWKNQLNSTLELHVISGVVSGRFESGVGDDGNTIWIDISGRVLEDLITFNAVYPMYGTVVSWVGQHTEESGIGKIKTHWRAHPTSPIVKSPFFLALTTEAAFSIRSLLVMLDI